MLTTTYVGDTYTIQGSGSNADLNQFPNFSIIPNGVKKLVIINATINASAGTLPSSIETIELGLNDGNDNNAVVLDGAFNNLTLPNLKTITFNYVAITENTNGSFSILNPSAQGATLTINKFRRFVGNNKTLILFNATGGKIRSATAANADDMSKQHICNAFAIAANITGVNCNRDLGADQLPIKLPKGGCVYIKIRHVEFLEVGL